MVGVLPSWISARRAGASRAGRPGLIRFGPGDRQDLSKKGRTLETGPSLVKVARMFHQRSAIRQECHKY